MQAAWTGRNASSRLFTSRRKLSILLRRRSSVRQRKKHLNRLLGPAQKQPWLSNEVVVAFAEAGAEAEEVTGAVEAPPEGTCMSVNVPCGHVRDHLRVMSSVGSASCVAAVSLQCQGNSVFNYDCIKFSAVETLLDQNKRLFRYTACSYLVCWSYIQYATVLTVLVSTLIVWPSIPLIVQCDLQRQGWRKRWFWWPRRH